MLDVSSTSKGFLPPRMTSEERDAIVPPIPAGLTIFNTTTNCTNVYHGAAWFELCGVCTPMPSPANAGDDQTGLTGNSTNLAANVPTAGAGSWSILSGSGGSIDDPLDPASEFTGLSGETYVLEWSITSVCGSNSDQVTVGFIPLFTCGQSVDYAGTTYTTAQFGDKCWFTKNLNVGTALNLMTNSSDNGVIEKYCYNGDPANCTTWGGLYQWNELMNYSSTAGSQGICPSGWHVATNAEWGAAISLNATALLSQNSGVLCNGGNCGGNIYYANGSTYGYYWTSTEQSATEAHRRIFSGNSNFQTDFINKNMGQSARCVQD